MIICHKYKFIFFKTNKTAGTSIEIGLSKFCDEYDVITPISEKDELLRIDFGGRGPQNCYHHLSKYNIKNWFRSSKKKKDLKFYNHMPANEVKALISKDIWDSYFKFCFVRNPWDAVISLYHWKYRNRKKPSLSESIKKDAHLLKEKGHDIYKINGEVVVDKIYKYENLEIALKDISNKLKLPTMLDIPRAKSKHRSDNSNYTEILTDNDKIFIQNTFKKEIERFEYTFKH